VPPLVSVVAPFYNQAAFARETIESVLAQDYPHLQVIATDDGSSDGTGDILREYEAAHPDLVRAVLVEENTGIAGNMNRGLAQVRGELVAWLGGDDVMLPGKIARQVEAMERRPDAVACAHDAEVFESESGRVLGRFTELYGGRPGVREGGIELQFDPTYFMLPSATMFRMAAAPPHGFDERLRFGNDLLWQIELQRHGPVIAVQDVLVRYRRHGGNITSARATHERTLEEGLMTMAIVLARYPELAKLAHRRSAAFFLAAARQARASGDHRLMARYLGSAFREGGPIGTPRMALRLADTRRRRGGGTPDAR
jgi:glycosyltransferase involved in cell wall biosynthesis